AEHGIRDAEVAGVQTCALPILARFVDGSRFEEFKPLYGSNLVTGWGSVHGFPVGVLANDKGVLYLEEAQKAAQFIQLANRSDLRSEERREGKRVGAGGRRTAQE